MALVSPREATVRFGGPPVLDAVSLSVEKGERACVTGRNGEVLQVAGGHAEAARAFAAK